MRVKGVLSPCPPQFVVFLSKWVEDIMVHPAWSRANRLTDGQSQRRAAEIRGLGQLVVALGLASSICAQSRRTWGRRLETFTHEELLSGPFQRAAKVHFGRDQAASRYLCSGFGCVFTGSGVKSGVGLDGTWQALYRMTKRMRMRTPTAELQTMAAMAHADSPIFASCSITRTRGEKSSGGCFRKIHFLCHITEREPENKQTNKQKETHTHTHTMAFISRLVHTQTSAHKRRRVWVGLACHVDLLSPQERWAR